LPVSRSRSAGRLAVRESGPSLRAQGGDARTAPAVVRVNTVKNVSQNEPSVDCSCNLSNLSGKVAACTG
jgi:hypothetical protein